MNAKMTNTFKRDRGQGTGEEETAYGLGKRGDDPASSVMLRLDRSIHYANRPWLTDTVKPLPEAVGRFRHLVPCPFPKA